MTNFALRPEVDTHEPGAHASPLAGVTTIDQVQQPDRIDTYLVVIEKPTAEILVRVYVKADGKRRLVCTYGRSLEIVDVSLENASPWYHTPTGVPWWALMAAMAVMMRRQGV